MVFHTLSLILAGILSISDYVTEHIFSEKLRKNQKLISFSAGAAISYIVLNLFPEIATFALIEGKKLFIYTLIGFVSLNLIEQYVYKKNETSKNISAYHRSIHVIYFFTYNFLIGMVLVSFTTRGLSRALLFFVPFLLYIIVEILPQKFEFRNNTSKVLYSMAPFFGALFGIYYIEIIDSIFGGLISFITGTLLYIVIRESLPSDEAEKPFYFIAGVLSYSLILFLSWNLV